MIIRDIETISPKSAGDWRDENTKKALVTATKYADAGNHVMAFRFERWAAFTARPDTFVSTKAVEMAEADLRQIQPPLSEVDVKFLLDDMRQMMPAAIRFQAAPMTPAGQ